MYAGVVIYRNVVGLQLKNYVCQWHEKKGCVQLYNGWYQIHGNKLMIAQKERDGVNYHDSELNPYCYVKASDKHLATGDVEYTDKNTLSGERVVKVSYKKPYDVKRFRDSIKEKGVEVYEADVPFIRRWMIDLDKRINLDYEKLYYDIETNGNIIESIAVVGNGVREWFHGNEKNILIDFLDLMKSSDMALGWFNLGTKDNPGFDRPFVNRALEKHGIKNNLNNLVELDLCELYKRIPGISSPSWELDYIGKKEVDMKKIKIDFKSHTVDELREYNLMDVDITKAIDEKLGLSDIRIGIANFSHIFPDNAVKPMTSIDSILLKKADELKIVLPCKKILSGKKIEKSEKYKGADIFEPVVGRHENVAVLDFEGLYPNIIIFEKISPDVNKILLPETLKVIIEPEKVCKQKYKETGDISWKIRRESLKILRNAVIGVFGNIYFRLHDNELSGDVTEVGREKINLVRDSVNVLPKHEVIFGHTDSTFIKVSSLENANDLKDLLNKQLHPYKVGLDKYFSALIFTGNIGLKKKEQGIKNRYAGYDELDGGELKIVGLEARRSDSIELMRRIQRRMIELILDGNSEKIVERYCEMIRGRFFEGKLDNELVFSIGVKGNVNDYKVEQPHVRAYRKLLERGIKPFGKVHYVVTRSGEEPVIDGKIPGNIDRKWYWDVRIKPIIKRLMSVYEVKKQTKLEV